MAILLGGLFVAYHRGGLQSCCNRKEKLSFTGMGTREFKHSDRPDAVSSAGGELEMQQPGQSQTLPGQPAHAMQMQQPQGGGAAEMEAAIRMSEEEASKRAASQATAQEQEELRLALALSASQLPPPQTVAQPSNEQQDVEPDGSPVQYL